MQAISLRGISRIQSKGDGWLVRIYRSTKVISKFFSDGTFGGSQRSLRAAQKYHRQLEKQFPATKPPFRDKLLPNNKTGYNGICETYARTKKGRKVYCWAVSWYNPPNKLRCKSFYFHDERERKRALKQAIRFRKACEAEILTRLHKGKRHTASS